MNCTPAAWSLATGRRGSFLLLPTMRELPERYLTKPSDGCKKATQVPTEHMMMSATHTHSAPAARGAEPVVFGSKTLDEYQEFFIQRIVKGVQRAVNYLRPAQRGWGGQVPQHVFNRR